MCALRDYSVCHNILNIRSWHSFPTNSRLQWGRQVRIRWTITCCIFSPRQNIWNQEPMRGGRGGERRGMVSPKVFFSSKAPQLFYEMLVMCLLHLRTALKISKLLLASSFWSPPCGFCWIAHSSHRHDNQAI